MFNGKLNCKWWIFQQAMFGYQGKSMEVLILLGSDPRIHGLESILFLGPPCNFPTMNLPFLSWKIRVAGSSSTTQCDYQVVRKFNS